MPNFAASTNGALIDRHVDTTLLALYSSSPRTRPKISVVLDNPTERVQNRYIRLFGKDVVIHSDGFDDLAKNVTSYLNE